MAASAVPQVVMDANTVTTIINNINSLYSNAISQLTSYTLGVVAIVGILIPALVTLIQWRSLKAEKESLEKTIQGEIDKAKSTIHDELLAEIKTQLSSVEHELITRMEQRFEKLDKQLKCTNAATFLLQANGHIKAGDYHKAVSNLCVSAKGFLNGCEEQNGQAAISNLIEICLPKINKTQYEELEMETLLNKLIDYLSEINVNGRYRRTISELKEEIRKVKLREPAMPVK